MKRFLTKTSLFIILPALLAGFFEALLPPTFFTYRTWEALRFKSGIVPHYSTFYPDTKSTMYAEGDLCFHTKYTAIKKDVWQTDQLGFRNDSLIKDPDILLLGDSFITGLNGTQEELFSKQLSKALESKATIYNMAPATFSLLDKYLQQGVIKKPKLLVYETVERNYPDRFVPFKKSFVTEAKDAVGRFADAAHLSIPLDKGLRFYSLEWMKFRVREIGGSGVPSADSTLFFMQGRSQGHTEMEFKATIDNIISYKKYCDAAGIRFLFMPLPDKESVYFEKVPFAKQPDHLFRVDSMLRAAGVATVNTLGIYNNYRKEHNQLLYYRNDTHWNPNGIAVMSQVLAARIKSGEFGKIVNE